MAIQYGKTWWGQQWLNSLSKIDNSNRLPRGRTYANKGLVKNIEIETNTISAKVQGSSPRPYKVKVSVSVFSDKQKKQLLEEILNNPSLLAKLLNRELPEGLAKFSDTKNIALFPKSWRDFPMDCSCPDSAVPCKHLAAVIYVIANEIDKNPFLVFQLHGFDVLEEVGKRYLVGKKSGIRVNEFKELFGDSPIFTATIEDDIFDTIDFSGIEPMSEKLLKIIQENPVFSEKNFKNNLAKAYKLIVKGTAQLTENERDIVNGFHLGSGLNIVISETQKVQEFQFITTDGEVIVDKKPDFNRLKTTLYFTGEKYFDSMSDAFRVMKIAHQFCLKLLKNGAVIPQLLKSKADEYFVRWLPAMNNSDIKSIVLTLSRAIPPDLIQLQDKKKVRYQDSEEQILTLCSLFLNHYVGLYTQTIGEYYRGKWSFTPLDGLFFQNTPLEFKGFRDKETPMAIQSWLNNYYITQKDFVPILRVEENEQRGTFFMGVLVENRKEQDAPIELVEILQKKKYENIRFEVLQDLLLLSNHFPALDGYLQSQGKSKM